MNSHQVLLTRTNFDFHLKVEDTDIKEVRSLTQRNTQCSPVKI